MKWAPITILSPLFLTSCTTAASSKPWLDNYNQPRSAEIPNEVRTFIIQRQGCDHFRGEIGYDMKRKKFLDKQIEKLCTGTDARLSRLQVKYATIPAASKALSEFEQCIEPFEGRDCNEVIWVE
ncbi:hypothetical protein SAMN02745824_3118 [Parasphingorhabdus marina DSM 22363]|uniref:UrcA family protein n=1 Tax=Parasphingorhabdus marina DSM 22363 TaxID=1123272 RepID=A0A1N6H3M8_9SPHN|nr:hypothetical protein [Parasphingorhabdus marina]SIO14359.1 hypothetical protein SAMN02745824_3118 [Parasphingorhabdus marina DSM 22363]